MFNSDDVCSQWNCVGSAADFAVVRGSMSQPISKVHVVPFGMTSTVISNFKYRIEKKIFLGRSSKPFKDTCFGNVQLKGPQSLGLHLHVQIVLGMMKQ